MSLSKKITEGRLLREKERGEQTSRGGSEKHVYLLQISGGFPSGERSKVEIRLRRNRQTQTGRSKFQSGKQIFQRSGCFTGEKDLIAELKSKF